MSERRRTLMAVKAPSSPCWEWGARQAPPKHRLSSAPHEIPDEVSMGTPILLMRNKPCGASTARPQQGGLGLRPAKVKRCQKRFVSKKDRPLG